MTTMNANAEVPFLERPAFFDGQRLAAADLGAAQDYHRELRWLHNRSLHGWGIAFGLGVSGARGGETVRVLPGYALDCLGRDLVLDSALDLPIPSVSGTASGGAAAYYLTIAYADDASLAPTMRNGACGRNGAVRRLEAVVARWQDPADPDPTSRYRQGLDVVLGEVRVQNCRLAADVSGHERRDAVPPQQPFIAAGATEPGATTWRLWPDDKGALGVVTTVPTSAVGFRITPRYQAHVAGERLYEATPGGMRGLADGHSLIAQATPLSFELRVILASGSAAGPGRTVLFTESDYAELIDRVCKELQESMRDSPTPNPLAALKSSVRALNGESLEVGTKLKVEVVAAGFNVMTETAALVKSDFSNVLTKMAGSSTTIDAVLTANDLHLDSITLTIGQPIIVPGVSVPLNPAEVLTAPFVDRLKTELAWHVVWMGVEG